MCIAFQSHRQATSQNDYKRLWVSFQNKDDGKENWYHIYSGEVVVKKPVYKKELSWFYKFESTLIQYLQICIRHIETDIPPCEYSQVFYDFRDQAAIWTNVDLIPFGIALSSIQICLKCIRKMQKRNEDPKFLLILQSSFRRAQSTLEKYREIRDKHRYG